MNIYNSIFKEDTLPGGYRIEGAASIASW